MLTLPATVLAIIAPCSPTEDRAHIGCQWQWAGGERGRAVLFNQRFWRFSRSCAGPVTADLPRVARTVLVCSVS